LISFVEVGHGFEINAGAERFSLARKDQSPPVLPQTLKDCRDLFGEFEVHRVRRRTPQGHDGDRTAVNNIDQASRHFALPCRVTEFRPRHGMTPFSTACGAGCRGLFRGLAPLAIRS